MHAAFTKDGVHPLEQAFAQAFLDDLDNGIPTAAPKPELYLIDEPHKHDADQDRHHRRAQEIGQQARTEMTEALAAAGTVDLSERAPLTQALNAVSNGIAWVARGGHTPEQLQKGRSTYDTRMHELGGALRAAGVTAPLMMTVRKIMDTHARTAGQHGQAREVRETAWAARRRGAVPVAPLDPDTIAQAHAAAATRAPSPTAAASKNPSANTSATPSNSRPAPQAQRTRHHR